MGDKVKELVAVSFLVAAMETVILAHLLADIPVSPAQDIVEVFSRDC